MSSGVNVVGLVPGTYSGASFVQHFGQGGFRDHVGARHCFGNAERLLNEKQTVGSSSG